MNELLTLTAAELGERIAARQISSEEVTQAHLESLKAGCASVQALKWADSRNDLTESALIQFSYALGYGPCLGHAPSSLRP